MPNSNLEYMPIIAQKPIKSILADYEGVIGPQLETLPISKAIIGRMSAYISELARISPEKVADYRKKLLRKHDTDTTCIALMLEHGITVREFNSVVFARDFETIQDQISVDSELVTLLSQVKAPIAILSNTTEEYVNVGLAAQGLKKLFVRVMGIETMFPHTKPGIKAYTNALSLTGFAAKESMFIDDKDENLVAPKTIGMTSVHISANNLGVEVCDYKFIDMKEVARELVRAGI